MQHYKTLEPGAYPQIPVMRGQVIFVDDLEGGNLLTYVQYSDIKIGDQIVAHWRGRDIAGRAVDEDVLVDVTEFNFEDGRVQVQIGNIHLEALRGGEAFYSYEVLTPTSVHVGESLRLICFIDRPAAVDMQLPVAQIRESHGLIIDLTLISSEALVCAPPYQAMAVGDEVTLTWQGYRSADDSQPITPWTQRLTLTVADLGVPMVWALPKSELRKSDGYHGALFYRVDYAAPQVASVSIEQQFIFGSVPSSADCWATQTALPPYLEAPQLPDFPGGALDPAGYPAGLRVRCPIYRRMLNADAVFLHWIGSANEVIRTLQVDPSVMDSQKLEFLVNPAELASLGLGNSEVYWHFARLGSQLKSDVLPLPVRPALRMPFPLIDGINQDPGEADNQGYLRPDAIARNGGVTVRVPEGAEFGGATLHMHWEGDINGGQLEQHRPLPDESPPAFLIPAQYAAPNMGDSEAKRFNVFYRAVLDVGGYVDSEPFRLLIRAPDTQYLPHLACSEATSDNRLSLGQARATGVTLRLDRWLLMQRDQRLWVEGVGNTPAGDQRFWATANQASGQTITPAEVLAGYVSLRVPADTFNAFTTNTSLRLTVQLSFDNGTSRIDFPRLDLQLIN
ncbi:hypothetical protein [Pseudomonas sp. Marseille-Q5115]|uniref:hypothetical protein n=1 Tax=Pseudomonas sp. Marseille-Q5115 TaxID=2866593 RepID=UPI001CE3CFAC|nr:hypothetical protein [Pseudomonas sp. Marseille-Q5115]